MELQKKSYARISETIPEALKGLQVNGCKNPACTNFCVDPHDYNPAEYSLRKGSNPFYKISGSGRNEPNLQCRVCSEITPIKSNVGILEEVSRISSYLHEPSCTCPNTECNNHLMSVSDNPNLYKRHGQTSGNTRYQCKLCKKTFSDGNKRRQHRRSEINKSFFLHIVNKTPMRRMCEILDISSKTYFDKLNWLYEQSSAFAKEREIRLLKTTYAQKAEICTDRQVHISNWSDRRDKRNIELWAIGSADNISGYVFGVHFNYDPLIDRTAAEIDASEVNAKITPPHPQPHARLWLQRYHNEELSMATHEHIKGLSKLENSSFEQAEILDGTTKLPDKGALVHSEYTMYAHFLLVARLLGNVKQVHYSLDREAGIRNAFMLANKERVSNGSAHAFYVKNRTGLTVDEKKEIVKDFYKAFKVIAGKSFRSATGTERYNTIISMLRQNIPQTKLIPFSKEMWLRHPHFTMPEPEKLVAALTPITHLSIQEQAELYKPSSLAAIDRFFMFVRRRVSLLERSKSVASSERRKWYGYSAYDPYSYLKVMEIVRLFYNYCLKAKDGTTAAMRLGLAKRPIRLESIVYFEK